MLSAYFLRKTHSIMTNCKFVIGNEVKHLGMRPRGCTRDPSRSLDDNTG